MPRRWRTVAHRTQRRRDDVTLPVARPVPRVLRRERHETGAPDPREPGTAPVRSTWRARPAPTRTRSRPLEVDRVTDHVLHTIDRRIARVPRAARTELSDGAREGDDHQHEHAASAVTVQFNPEEYTRQPRHQLRAGRGARAAARRCCSSRTATCRRSRWSCCSTPTRRTRAATANGAGDDVRPLVRSITDLMNIDPDHARAAGAAVHLGLALVHVRARPREPEVHHVPPRRHARARRASRSRSTSSATPSSRRRRSSARPPTTASCTSSRRARR